MGIHQPLTIICPLRVLHFTPSYPINHCGRAWHLRALEVDSSNRGNLLPVNRSINNDLWTFRTREWRLKRSSEEPEVQLIVFGKAMGQDFFYQPVLLAALLLPHLSLQNAGQSELHASEN